MFSLINKVLYRHSIGQIYQLRHTFTEQNVKDFSELSLDKNPIHLDEKVAAEGMFKERVVYGLLSASLFSGLIGNNIPKAIYLKQNLEFVSPIFYNQEVKAMVRIEKITMKKNRKYMKLDTQIYIVKNDKLAVSGTANIMITD